MSEPAAPASPPAPLPTTLLAAWLAQSHDLLALTDADGSVRWCNASFERATGFGVGSRLLTLAPVSGVARDALSGGLHNLVLPAAELALRAADGAALWVQARVTAVESDRLWTLRDTTAHHKAGVAVDEPGPPAFTPSREDTAMQLRLATSLAGIVIWRHDLKTARVHYNEHGFKALGVRPRPEGLSLDEVRAHTHPDDAARLEASAERALATGLPVDVEVRHRRADGAWRYMLVRRVVERDAAGDAIAFVGVTLDVTSQVEQSRRTEQLTRRLEAAAKAARVGIWTTVIGTRETEWNAQMYQLFDLVDLTEAPTLSEWLQRCVHPDDTPRVKQTAHAFLKRETRAFEIEFRTRLRDGRTRWMVLRADLDRSGTEPARVFGIAMDVTDRHEALAALHTASERSALIARHAGIGTWETDEDGGPAQWDEQMWHLRGLEPRPVALGREERLALAHPDDRAHVLDANPELDRSTRAMAYEFRVRVPDGSYRWLASRSAVLLDEHGKVARRVGVNWDITEAKNADLARQHALLAERESEAKSQFLSRMSHELRTPLNAVLGFTQLLQLDDGREPVQDRAEKLGHIRAAGEHLLTLIDDALDLSSLQSGTLRLELQAVSLAQAVAQALPLVGELAAAHRVLLRCGTLAGAVRADPTRLRQVLLNLLTNAIKYNRAGGEVEVDAHPTGDEVRLRVRDNGRGMTPDQLGHLFEPFNRLGIEREGIEGSGIGLTISRALVEGMGGRIEVSSDAGRGTAFVVVLPREDVATTQAAPVEAPATARAGRSGQLLYIEDNVVNVLLVEELVNTVPGLRIVSEATGAAGVARARALQPDLILVDMQLPDFDGFEVLRQLRASVETASTRCIALSANAMPDDIERGLAAGFDDYWTKPIRFQPFFDALDRLFPPAVA